MELKQVKDHYDNILKELSIILEKEKIIDSTNPISILAFNIELLKGSPVISSADKLMERLNLMLSDLYRTITYRNESLLEELKNKIKFHTGQELDVKETKLRIEKEAKEIVKKTYHDQIKYLDFICDEYYKFLIIQSELSTLMKQVVKNIYQDTLSK